MNASGTATVRAARDIQIAVGTNIGNPTGTLTISGNANVSFAGRLMSGKQHDGGGAGGDNGGIINLNLSDAGIFRQDDVLDLASETSWNFLAHNPTSVANVTVTGGLMSFDARTYFARNGTGTFNQSGGVVEVRRGEMNFGEGGSAIYNLSGGTLRTVSGGPIVLGLGMPGGAGDGRINVSATGVLNASSNLIVGGGDDPSGAPLATGTLTQSGGQVIVGGDLRIANATLATGTYNLQGGVLDLTNGSIAKGAGVASFNFTGGRLRNAAVVNLPLVQQGGILAPGAVAAAGITTINGNYSLQSAGTIELSILSPTVSDQILVNGTVALGGSLLVTDDPPGLPIGAAFLALINDGTDPITGTFTGLPQGQDLLTAAGNSFDVSYIGGDGNDVQLIVVVPEPATAAILLGGCGLLMLHRRRRVPIAPTSA